MGKCWVLLIPVVLELWRLTVWSYSRPLPPPKKPSMYDLVPKLQCLQCPHRLTNHRNAAACPPTYSPSPFCPARPPQTLGLRCRPTRFHICHPTPVIVCSLFEEIQEVRVGKQAGYSIAGPLLGHVAPLRKINSDGFHFITSLGFPSFSYADFMLVQLVLGGAKANNKRETGRISSWFCHLDQEQIGPVLLPYLDLLSSEDLWKVSMQLWWTEIRGRSIGLWEPQRMGIGA